MSKMEYRSFALRNITIETRVDEADDDKRTLTGYASVFNSDSGDLGFIEQIAPGAFTRSLDAVEAGQHNIHALWAHNSEIPLGSTRGGKLTLEQDETGLWFDLDTSRFTPAQLDAAADGDLEVSFGFAVREDEWTFGENGEPDRRVVRDLDLYEISPVIWAAYGATSANLREARGIEIALERRAAALGSRENINTEETVSETVEIVDERRATDLLLCEVLARRLSRTRK